MISLPHRKALRPAQNVFLFLRSGSIRLDRDGTFHPRLYSYFMSNYYFISWRFVRGHLGSKWKGERWPPAARLKTRNCLSVIGMGHTYTKLAHVKPSFIWLPQVLAYGKPLTKCIVAFFGEDACKEWGISERHALGLLEALRDGMISENQRGGDARVLYQQISCSWAWCL